MRKGVIGSISNGQPGRTLKILGVFIFLSILSVPLYWLVNDQQARAQSLTEGYNRFTYIGMRVDTAPFNDAGIRQAIYIALDRLSISDQVGGEKVTSIVTPLDPRSYVDRDQDIDQAKQLLTDGGYPNGFQTTISSSDELEPVMSLIIEQLNTIGIEATPVVMERNSLEVQLNEGQPEFFLIDTAVDWQDTPELLGRLLLSSGSENFTGYSVDAFDKNFLSESFISSEEIAFSSSGLSIIPLFWSQEASAVTTVTETITETVTAATTVPVTTSVTNVETTTVTVTETTTVTETVTAAISVPVTTVITRPVPTTVTTTSTTTDTATITVSLPDNHNGHGTEIAIIAGSIIAAGIAGFLLIKLGPSFLRSAKTKPPKMDTTRSKPSLDTDLKKMAKPPASEDTGEMAKVPAAGVSPAMERYVNLWFTEKQTDISRIAKKYSLVQNKTVFLRVQIAAFDDSTLLTEARPFPRQEDIEKVHPELKGKVIPLDVTIYSNDFKIPYTKRTQSLSLKLGQPTETLYFPVQPQKIGVSRLRVCIFYRAHLLQSLDVSASVSLVQEESGQPQKAKVGTTFSADFTSALAVKPRRLWLGINRIDESTHFLNIMAEPEGEETGRPKKKKVALSRTLSEAKIEDALKFARQALREVAFETGPGGQLGNYRFGADNRPVNNGQPIDGNDLKERFKNDLAKLAGAGNYIYEAVLGSGCIESGEDAAEVKPIKALMKAELLNEKQQIIQITRLKAIEDIWPWAIMYDLPVDMPENITEVCPGFRNHYGSIRSYEACRTDCRHPEIWKADGRFRTIICPYGFWGFRHIIEQPYRQYRDPLKAFTDLPTVIEIKANPVLKMPVEVNLLSQIPEHGITMGKMQFEILNSYTATRDACEKAPEPHVLYFFCHGAHRPGLAPYLIVGNNTNILSSDLETWQLDWTKTHTLVFINGCNTVDLEPRSLSMLMAPFVEANVSGIIGTEVAVHIQLASEFARQFFQAFLPNGQEGKPVGEIIRDVRLDLLGKFNPLGLVYTPYCSADLHMSKK